MRRLGLKKSLDSCDILSIALDIQAEMDEHATEFDAVNNCLKTSSSSSLSSTSILEIEQKVTSRAMKLLEYLEMNIERIFHECSSDSLQYYKNNQKVIIDVDNNVNDNKMNIIDKKNSSNILSELGGQWAQELRWIRWIPVFVQPPSSSSSSSSSFSHSYHLNILPWSLRVHCRPLASPSQCYNLNDLWLCSSTTRICRTQVKSDLLLEVLGWNRPISGKNIYLMIFLN